MEIEGLGKGWCQYRHEDYYWHVSAGNMHVLVPRWW